MKRISFLLMMLALWVGVPARAQDAATEERLNKLNGRIEDLMAAQESMKAQLQTLTKEIDSLRGQVNTPSGNYASQEDLKRVADAVKEIDRKRLEDYDKIRAELKRIANAVSSPGPSSGHKQPASTVDDTSSQNTSKPASDKGFEYVIQKGDTLSVIVQAYKEKNIKVTTDDILKANPGLKAEKLKVGQKIFIPAPQQ
jgi:LysM repeat protein